MGVILEIRAGALTGRKVALAARQSHTFGRAEERAKFAVPDDKQMSGMHFAVECGADGCRVVDKGSTNGTFLNGARIREAMLLANGDEIKAGATTFVVRIVPDHPPAAPAPRAPSAGAVPVALSPPRMQEARPPSFSGNVQEPTLQERPAQAPLASRPTHVPASTQQPVPGSGGAAGSPPQQAASTKAGEISATKEGAAVSAAKQVASGAGGAGHAVKPPALAIGSWAFHKIPERWQIQEGLGIQQVVKDAFAPSIVVTEEMLAVGSTLAQYVEAQSKMLHENLSAPKVDAVAAPAIPGSAETLALEVRFTIKDGPAVFFHRVYVRSGAAVGVLNFTSLQQDLSAARPTYDSALTAISFAPKTE